MVVLIDEYLTSQLCHGCHNKLIPQFGEPHEKYRKCDVDSLDCDINAAKNLLEVLLFHVCGWGRPDYLCRPDQHHVEAVQAPRTANV
jgi:transposase